jgi:hypothetical protein
MESLFLNIIQSLSDSRFWLGPLILFCITIIAGITALEATGIDFEKYKNV